MVQLSRLYMTTGKAIVLTVQTSVSKVMSLLFNTLSQFIIDFLPRSRHFIILWLQSQSAVILEPKKIKSVTVSTFPPSICHEVIVNNILMIKKDKQHFNTKIFLLLFRNNGLGFLQMVNFSGIFEILQCAVAMEDEAQDLESSTLRF